MVKTGQDSLTLRLPDLQQAVESRLLTNEQSEALWQFLADRSAERIRVRFDIAHLLWYTGALIVIGAMGLYLTLAFARWGGLALTMTAAIYTLLFVVLGRYLWQRQLKTPGGLCLTVAVTMTPLLVYGIQDMLGWWTGTDPGTYRDFFRWIKASWLPMEAATILVGLVTLTLYRFPFLTAPIAVALWLMSMDLVPWIVGEDWNSWDQQRIVSLWFGLIMIGLAWLVDIKARNDLAFWLHLFGLMAFWGGLSLAYSESELAKAFYCLINIGLLTASVFLQRRAYAVFGAIGLACYLGHLAGHVFQDSLLYPFALSFLGLKVLGAGLLYYHHQTTIEEALKRHLPVYLQALRPAHARGI